jgi:Tfp pilus assembly protein PilF
MKRLCQVFALCGLLVVATVALVASEPAAERNSSGVKLLDQGQMDGAIAEFQKALASDPRYFPARLNLAFAYERAGKIEDAMAAYRSAIDAQPGNFFAHNNLGVLYDKTGQHEAAVAELEKALAIEPGNSLASKNLDNSKKNLAAIKQRNSLIDKAEKEAQAKPNDPRAAYHVARLHAHYNNKELALQWLNKAIKQGYNDLAYVKVDPAFSSLREDRDFELLLLKK